MRFPWYRWANRGSERLNCSTKVCRPPHPGAGLPAVPLCLMSQGQGSASVPGVSAGRGSPRGRLWEPLAGRAGCSGPGTLLPRSPRCTALPTELTGVLPGVGSRAAAAKTRRGGKLQPCCWFPLRQISLLTKIKRTQLTPVFAVGPLLSFSREEPGPVFQTGSGPQASKGKFRSRQGPWRGAPENGSAPRGERPGVARAQGLISAQHILSHFPWHRGCVFLGWEVGREGRTDGPGALGCRASIF